MRRKTKQRIWYRVSQVICLGSVVGLFSAVGQMETEQLPVGRGFAAAVVCLALAAVFGRLAEAIHAVWEREKRSTDTPKRVA